MVTIKKIRREINTFPEEWMDIIENPKFKKRYHDLEVEPGLKASKIPSGFASDHIAAEYLKLKSFTATMSISDNDFFSEDIEDQIVSGLLVLKPMISYLNRGILDNEKVIL
jgi:uncharacterized protein (DUF2461 family)